jgi:hypothetical protein
LLASALLVFQRAWVLVGGHWLRFTMFIWAPVAAPSSNDAAGPRLKAAVIAAAALGLAAWIASLGTS